MPRYVFPPRPKGKMEPRNLPIEEARGVWVAQYKYKGTRNLVHVEKDGTIRFYNRHRSEHRAAGALKALPLIARELQTLNLEKGVEYVIDGELMDHFTELKGTLVLYDILWAGKYLYGFSQEKRLAMLDTICGHPTAFEPGGRAFLVTPHVWMAPVFRDHFSEHFATAAARPDLEGLVLRRLDAKLDNMGNAEYETTSQLRCRRPEKVHGSF